MAIPILPLDPADQHPVINPFAEIDTDDGSLLPAGPIAALALLLVVAGRWNAGVVERQIWLANDVRLPT